MERFQITSAKHSANFDAARSIDVDRENLYGLDAALYVGMVHFNDVPLNGEPSDLTARFHLKRPGSDGLILEFVDLHVM